MACIIVINCCLKLCFIAFAIKFSLGSSVVQCRNCIDQNVSSKLHMLQINIRDYDEVLGNFSVILGDLAL